jgi:type IV secretion system protein VirB3
MTSDSGETAFADDVDPLFLGLTRPAMFWGVTHSYFVITLIVSLIGFLATHSWLALLLAVPIHGLGYLACLRDPRVFDLAFVKASKCARCANRRFWGATTYDLS